MKGTRNSYCFFTISTLHNDTTFVIEKGNTDEEAEKINETFNIMTKDNPGKRIILIDRKTNKQIVFNGERLLPPTIPQAEKEFVQDKVDKEILIDTFRRMPDYVVKKGIVKKWKKGYYAYGYLLLKENKFGTGYNDISVDNVMVILNCRNNNIDLGHRSNLYDFIPRNTGTFENNWNLKGWQGKRAGEIGICFIELYEKLRKEKTAMEQSTD